MCLLTATVHRKPMEELELADESSKTPVEAPVKTPELILQTLKAAPHMTLAEVADAIGKSSHAVERASAKLAKAGKLKYVGPRKGGHWEVIKR